MDGSSPTCLLCSSRLNSLLAFRNGFLRELQSFCILLHAWNDCSDLLYFVVKKPELLLCHPYALFPQCINDYADWSLFALFSSSKHWVTKYPILILQLLKQQCLKYSLENRSVCKITCWVSGCLWCLFYWGWRMHSSTPVLLNKLLCNLFCLTPAALFWGFCIHYQSNMDR